MIMDIFSIPPSKPVGILKNMIKEAILDGQIENNYDAAYDFMLEKAAAMGLTSKKSKSEIENHKS